MVKNVLITGANGGLGKDCARQLALLETTEKIYLGCRNPERAEAAKASLEQTTGKSVFEIVIMDVANLDSVRSAVASLPGSIDGLVMNAGGMGGKTPGEISPDGVNRMFAVNLLGHVVLFDELVKAGKLTGVALYAGSEAARGIPKMGMKRPSLKTSSVDEFASVCDGSIWNGKLDPMVAYGVIKYMAALWTASEARKNPGLRVLTVSPGSTSGTAVMEDLPPVMKFMFKHIGSRMMPLFGLSHQLHVGAKRYVDGLNDEAYQSGVSYASKAPTLTGPMVDQSTIFADLGNEQFQDNANEAIHRFIK